jgi:hypothetical protein
MSTTCRLAALLLFWLIIAQNGCVPIPRTYTKAELIGTYEISYSFGTDILILNSDNTYEQRFVDKSGKAFINRGKWDFEGGRDNQVSLINAVDVCDPFGKFASTTPHRGYSLRSFGWYRGTVISVNEDLGLYMRKIR